MTLELTPEAIERWSPAVLPSTNKTLTKILEFFSTHEQKTNDQYVKEKTAVELINALSAGIEAAGLRFVRVGTQDQT